MQPAAIAPLQLNTLSLYPTARELGLLLISHPIILARRALQALSDIPDPLTWDKITICMSLCQGQTVLSLLANACYSLPMYVVHDTEFFSQMYRVRHNKNALKTLTKSAFETF